MADMFDGVTARYDALNRLMTLGQDGAWRRALWRAVPEDARVVLDLCTGNGASLPGLRRPGRTVLGLDVSLGMLEAARDEHGGPGWSPRVACADAFRLPLRDASVDAVTLAFGLRNLRPRAEALAEIARVLRPGGTLAVLEATAPRPGPLAPLHRFHLRRVVPLLGRLSPDPSAYRYLGESILEFGDGTAFEAALSAAGFGGVRRRRFLLGASALWSARREASRGEHPPAAGPVVHSARWDAAVRGEIPRARAAHDRELRAWVGGQLAISAALTATLAWSLMSFHNMLREQILPEWQSRLGWLLLGGGLAASALRTAVLWKRFRDPPTGR